MDICLKGIVSKEKASKWRNRLCVKRFFFQKKEKGNCMNRTSKMEGSLSRKNATQKQSKLSGQRFIKKSKLLSVLQTTEYLEKKQSTHIKCSFFKDVLFSEMKSRLYMDSVSFRKSTVFSQWKQQKLIRVGNTLFWKSRAWFQTNPSSKIKDLEECAKLY